MLLSKVGVYLSSRKIFLGCYIFFLLFVYIFGKNPSNPLAAKASEIEYKLVKNFNFKDFNSDLRMMYRNNGHSEYFLSITTDNIPAYQFKKDRLVAYDVQELHINDCYISITNGNIQKYNNEYVTRNCEKYSKKWVRKTGP